MTKSASKLTICTSLLTILFTLTATCDADEFLSSQAHTPRALSKETSVEEENTWYYDDAGENEVEIRPEYDETKEYQYMPDNSSEDSLCKVSQECPQYPFLVCQ